MHGRIDPCFREKHKWTSQSYPHEFVEPFLLLKNNMSINEGKKEDMISFDLLIKWLNLKALISNTGQVGTF